MRNKSSFVDEVEHYSDVDSDRYYTTYLAIRDKATGKTRLVETRHSLLKPEVGTPVSEF
jgi:hypothetical protein